MECVTIAAMCLLVNGTPTEEFALERGLCQRDPLSPFLFLIAAKGFNILMNGSVDASLFTCYRIGEHV